jgi:hypothetical protein
MKKILKIVLVCLLIVSITPVSKIVIQAAEVKPNTTNISVRVGQMYQLKITGSSETPVWTSSNKKIVTVDSNGKIKGVKEGEATITSKVSEISYTTKIKVVKKITDEDFFYGEYFFDGSLYAITGSFFIDDVKGKEGYFTSYDTSSNNTEPSLESTMRHISVGDKSSKVLNAYGYAKYIKYSSKDFIHKYVAKNYPDVDVKSRWKSYLEYTYIEKAEGLAGEYRIRFYIDSNNKVTEVMYIKDYNSFK